MLDLVKIGDFFPPRQFAQKGKHTVENAAIIHRRDQQALGIVQALNFQPIAVRCQLLRRGKMRNHRSQISHRAQQDGVLRRKRRAKIPSQHLPRPANEFLLGAFEHR